MSQRNLSMAGLKVLGGELIWGNRRSIPAKAGAAEPSSDDSSDEYDVEARITEFVELDYIELQITQDEILTRIGAMTLEMQSLSQQQSEILQLLRACDPPPTTSSSDECDVEARIKQLAELVDSGYIELQNTQEEILTRMGAMTLEMRSLALQQSEILQLLRARDPPPTTFSSVPAPADDLMDFADN